ncbi:MAG: FtsX-like permease family protein, partial [Lachnospiraceae bacterium]|nr:FtsX-like permease family protein [Lachnospiraceae bacterium]
LYIWGTQEEKLALLKDVPQACYKNITLQQAEILKKDKRTLWAGLSFFAGASKNGNTRLKVIWQDKNYMEKDNIPYYGSLPSGSNEIMLPQDYLEKLGMPQTSPGDSITIDLGDGTARKYKISAISTKHSKSANSQTVYVSLPLAMKLAGIKGEFADADIIINNALDMDTGSVQKQIMELAEIAGIKEEQIETNYSFFNQSVMSKLAASDIITLALVILLVLIAAGIVIYNIFYISITGKIREYGQMQTIGMTQKQIKSLVLYEGIFLSVTGSTPGLLAGGILGYTLVPGGFNAINCIVSAIACLLLSLIFVGISVIKPGKTAASFSPVAAAGYTGYAKEESHRKKYNQHKLTPAYLASLNLKRNKKKRLLTMCSLIISGIMLGTIASYIVSYDPASSVEFSFPTGEYQLSLDTPSGFGNDTSLEGHMKALSSLQTDNLMEELEKELENIKGVTKVQSWHYMIAASTDLSDNKNFPLAGLNGITKQDFELLKEMDYKGPDKYEELLEKPGLIITNEFITKLQEQPLSTGDIVDIVIYDGNGVRKEYKLPVTATIKLNPWHRKNRTKHLPVSITGASFMMPYEILDKWSGLDTVYGYEITTEPGLTKDIGAILEETYGMEENLYISSKPELREYYENQYFPQKIILYVFVAFLLIFGIINLVNTIITNLYSRKKELGILQAVGMTDIQLKTMFKRETLSYTGISAACTLIFGSLLGYALVMAEIQLGTSMVYSFPWFPILLYILIMFFTQQYLAGYGIKLLHKETLVERMKNTE